MYRLEIFWKIQSLEMIDGERRAGKNLKKH